MKLQLILIFVLAVTAKCDLEYANVDSQDLKAEIDNDLSNSSICSEDLKLFVQILMNKVDANKDSILDKQELHDAYLAQIRNVHEIEILEEIRQLNLERDSERISFETYGKATFESYEDLKAGKLTGAEFGEMRNLYEKEKKKWEFISGKLENSESTLSRMQFYSFIYSEEFPHIHEYELGITFSQFDTNADAVLDVKEFIDAIKIVDETLIDFKSRIFTSILDLNGDNVLDLYEFQLWYNPSVEQKIVDEVRFLLDKCDADSNSSLNKTEIIERCDVLVKNQLTNYGNMFTNTVEQSRNASKQEL